MTRPYAVSCLLWVLLVRGGYVTVAAKRSMLTELKSLFGVGQLRLVGKYIANKVASLWRKLVG